MNHRSNNRGVPRAPDITVIYLPTAATFPRPQNLNGKRGREDGNVVTAVDGR